MAICENCKKYPLEWGEINEVENNKVLCNECYKDYFYKVLKKMKGGLKE